MFAVYGGGLYHFELWLEDVSEGLGIDRVGVEDLMETFSVSGASPRWWGTPRRYGGAMMLDFM